MWITAPVLSTRCRAPLTACRRSGSRWVRRRLKKPLPRDLGTPRGKVFSTAAGDGTGTDGTGQPAGIEVVDAAGATGARATATAVCIKCPSWGVAPASGALSTATCTSAAIAASGMHWLLPDHCGGPCRWDARAPRTGPRGETTGGMRCCRVNVKGQLGRRTCPRGMGTAQRCPWSARAACLIVLAPVDKAVMVKPT